MSEDVIQLNADGSGKKVRTLKRTVGSNEVHEEVHNITDGAGNVVDPRNIRPLTVSDTVVVQDLLRGLTDPATGKVVNEVDFTWNADNTMATAVFKDAAPATLFTLTMTYVAGNCTKILRS
jgi:hypothetical protein